MGTYASAEPDLFVHQNSPSDQSLIQEYEQRLEAAASQKMDPNTASQLSLLLSSLIPVDVSVCSFSTTWGTKHSS